MNKDYELITPITVITVICIGFFLGWIYINNNVIPEKNNQHNGVIIFTTP